MRVLPPTCPATNAHDAISSATMFKGLIDWYLDSLESGGYPVIALLMAIESSILPLPSEFVIPPAAHLAHTKGNLSMAGIIIAGTVGSWLGATVMYWMSRLAGRPAVLRYGRYVFVPPEKVEGAERKRIGQDRKSTRLNSSHVAISYAVFCLKKKKQIRMNTQLD